METDYSIINMKHERGGEGEKGGEGERGGALISSFTLSQTQRGGDDI